MLHIKSNVPILGGQTARIEIDFQLDIQEVHYRLGYWRGVTNLTNWYPTVAYHGPDGWIAPPFIGWHQPFLNEAGQYDVTLRAPATLAVVAGGQLTEESLLPDGRKEHRFTANGLRDFSIVASKRHEVHEAIVEGVKVSVHAFPEHRFYAKVALESATESIARYTKLLGPYPHPEFKVVETYFGWNGNETSGMVLIDERVFDAPKLGHVYVDHLVTTKPSISGSTPPSGPTAFTKPGWTKRSSPTSPKIASTRSTATRSTCLIFPKDCAGSPTSTTTHSCITVTTSTALEAAMGTSWPPSPRSARPQSIFPRLRSRRSRRQHAAPPPGKRALLRIPPHHLHQVPVPNPLCRRLRKGTRTLHRRILASLLRRLAPLSQIHRLEDRRCRCRQRRGWLPNQNQSPSARRDRRACHHRIKNSDGESWQEIRLEPASPDYAAGTAQIKKANDKTWEITLTTPQRPKQIEVDPKREILDENLFNNRWKPAPKVRFAPIYTPLEEIALARPLDRPSIVFGPSVDAEGRVGVRGSIMEPNRYRISPFIVYPLTVNDSVLAAGVDGEIFHVPAPNFSIGARYERTLATDLFELPDNQGEVYFRYNYLYTSSFLYPNLGYVDAYYRFGDNFFPDETFRRPNNPDAENYRNIQAAGVRFHLDTRMPYWNPERGFAIDAAYENGFRAFNTGESFNRGFGQISAVRKLQRGSAISPKQESLPGFEVGLDPPIMESTSASAGRSAFEDSDLKTPKGVPFGSPVPIGDSPSGEMSRKSSSIKLCAGTPSTALFSTMSASPSSSAVLKGSTTPSAWGSISTSDSSASSTGSLSVPSTPTPYATIPTSSGSASITRSNSVRVDSSSFIGDDQNLVGNWRTRPERTCSTPSPVNLSRPDIIRYPPLRVISKWETSCSEVASRNNS